MAVKPIKTPLANMSFTPDVPAQALADQEYSNGLNIETDTRGVRSVSGDEAILSAVTGHIIFVTAGYWKNQQYWFIVATREGKWYAVNGSGVTDITPGYELDNSAAFDNYTDGLPITESWNGNILFINDSVNPPMYLLPNKLEFQVYDAAPDNYVWNYNPDWSNLTAGFMRVYAAPNVGSILIAGNLSFDEDLIRYNSPATVRWSQAFGLNSGPTTWAPTLTNVANELEVPVRGPLVDGFAANGNFYLCSHLDTVVLSPIAYQSSSAPVFGVRLISQNHGMLNESCWCNTDEAVYGLDSRDIWMFAGGRFVSIGNQRVEKYFYDNLNPDYIDRTFMINNSAKDQIEIYYADNDSTGFCNRMLSYRYDLKIWNAPRTVSNACDATESPVWSSNTYNEATRGIVYAQGNTEDSQLVQKDRTNTLLDGSAIPTLFQRDSISFGQPYSARVQVHRVLPEITGTGDIDITVGGSDSAGSTIAYKPTETMAADTEYPWVQIDQNAARCVSLKVESDATAADWQMTALNWQITVVEDDR